MREVAMSAERRTESFSDSFGGQAQPETLRDKIKRSQPEVARLMGLTQQVVDEKGVAKNCYSKLCEAGLKRSEWFYALVAVAVLTGGKKKGNQDWCLATNMGMSAKTLSLFPRRVRNFADEIEKLNFHPLLGPEFWFFNPDLCFLQGLKLTDSLKKSLALWFGRLPRLLRCYADYVEWQSKTSSRRVRAHKRPKVGSQIRVLGLLIEFVREETDKSLYPELSEILTAVAAAAGMSKDFSVGLLKMAVLRSKELERKQSGPGSDSSKK
jgi:hypothetical protein